MSYLILIDWLGLEIVDLRTKLDDAVVKFICFLASMTAAFHDGTIKTNAAVFTLAWTGLTELQHTTTCISGNDDIIFAKCLHLIPVAATQENVEFDLAACQHYADKSNQTNAMQQVAALITNQIQTIIIRSIAAYNDAKKLMEQSLKVQELIKQFTTTTATDDVAMRLETEASADPETIKKLVAMEVAKATKRFVTAQKPPSNDRKPATIAAKPRPTQPVNNTQSAKNSKQGATQGTSIKKKLPNKKTATKGKGKKSAAGVADDSSNASSRSGSTRSTKKQPKNKKRSALKAKK